MIKDGEIKEDTIKEDTIKVATIKVATIKVATLTTDIIKDMETSLQGMTIILKTVNINMARKTMITAWELVAHAWEL
jgi:hypothetical protein